MHKGSSDRYLSKGPYESFHGRHLPGCYDQALFLWYGALQDLSWATYCNLEDPGVRIYCPFGPSGALRWALAGPSLGG